MITDDDGNFEKSLLPLFEPITVSSTLDEVGGIALAEAYLTTDGEIYDVGDMLLDETIHTWSPSTPKMVLQG